MTEAEEDVERLRRQMEALERPVVCCPRCRTDLTGRQLPPGVCGVCTEPVPDPQAARALLKRQLEAARDQVVRAQAHATSAEKDAAGADARMDDLQRRLDRATTEMISPHADQLAAARAAVAETTARLAGLQRLVEPHQRLRTLADELRAVQDQRRDLTRARSELIATYAVRRTGVLDDLNDIFADVVGDMDLPWYAGDARIDRETYLPIVDGQGFERHGGGTRAALAVGYHVTLLRYLLTTRLGELPTFLMIDSPTKNVGRNAWDARFAHRIYSSFVDFVAARTGAGVATVPFQVLIADNDLPKDVRSKVKVHDFDHDRPLIPGLDNPHGQQPD